MQCESPVLQVTVFGRIRLLYNGTSLLPPKGTITRPIQLFLLLLLAGSGGMSRDRLLETLYGREDMEDVSNNLRVTCHRLRKMLIAAGMPEHDYILTEQGTYRLDLPMKTEIDALRFQELCSRADQTDSEEERAELLIQACRLYGGEFLRELSGEDWALLESIRYRDLYFGALQSVSAYLLEHKRYEELLALVTPACELYPFDEWQAIKIDCYIGMKLYGKALKEYEDAEKLFSDELGIAPPLSISERLDTLEKHMGGLPQPIGTIQNILREEPEHYDAGAYCCSFMSFRDEYRLLRRISDRYGQSIYLMLCTITDGAGNTLDQPDKLAKLSAALRDAISRSLRRCDCFTRYNPSQFLILLMETRGEDCRIISDRIRNHFVRGRRGWGRYLSIYSNSIVNVGDETQNYVFQERRL